jgi:hypothetical protein
MHIHHSSCSENSYFAAHGFLAAHGLAFIAAQGLAFFFAAQGFFAAHGLAFAPAAGLALQGLAAAIAPVALSARVIRLADNMELITCLYCNFIVLPPVILM